VPETEGDPGAIPRTFPELQGFIFEPVCAAQCHRGGAAPKGLSLESRRAASDLVGVPSVELPELLRVAPGQPEQSFIVVKLAPFDARRVGSRMPRNGPPFRRTSTTPLHGSIRSWSGLGL